MNVLIVYHAGARYDALQIYRDMAETPNVEITAIAPAKLAVASKVYDQSGWLCLDKEQERDGYRLIPVPLNNPLNYYEGFETESLRRIMKATKADIIHVLDEPMSGYLYQIAWLRLLASRRSRVLFYGFGNNPHRLGRRARLKWRSTWSRIAGGTAANNEALSNLRKVGFPKNRPLERIFWGIPTDQFKVMEKPALKAELRLEFGHIVGYVGRLAPEKGLGVLLAAIRRLPSDVHCVIVGDGAMRAEVELWSAIPDLVDRVHLIGAVPSEDMARYLNCMDVLAVPSLTTPSWKEQFGRVIAEAMACGVPVVGSDSGAIPEVIASAGMISPEGDPGKLAEALSAVIFEKSLRTRLIQKGLVRAKEELSTVAFARKHLDFYERLMNNA